MADAHYLIRKEVDGDRTFTRVTDMDRRQRVGELARMLGGVEVTDTTLQHAQEMLDLAEAKKTKDIKAFVGSFSVIKRMSWG